MVINYVGTLKADITFDGVLTCHDMNDHYYTLQEYIDRATYLMEEYGFTSAEIVDVETGEVVIEMESDGDDFSDEPAYYDDGDTCGYE